MARRYRVFVSSASDMSKEREEAIGAIRSCDCIPRVMEDWTAGIRSPLRKILEEIHLADFFVVLLGMKYGKRPEWTADDKAALPNSSATWSYVRAEYEHARNCRKPIIALLCEEACPAGDQPQERDDAVLQRDFRTLVRNTLLTKTWHSTKDIAAHVSSALLDKIRPLETAVIVPTNAELICEVAKHINMQLQKNAPAKQARLIQYSSRNVRDIIRKLVWSKVHTELYIVADKFALEHQRSIVKQGIQALANHLEPVDPLLTKAEVLSYLTIFRYKAPGAIRAISIDNEFLALGSYVYMQKHRQGGKRLDIRGGELPMTIFPNTHYGFPVVKGMVDGLIRNWHDHGLVERLSPREIDRIY